MSRLKRGRVIGAAVACAAAALLGMAVSAQPAAAQTPPVKSFPVDPGSGFIHP